MTDENQELEVLRAKNAELLNELKAAKAKLREFEGADATLADQLKAVTQELTDIKTADLMQSSWAAAGITPSMAKYALQEVGFALSLNDDGLIVAVNKETGEVVTGDSKKPLDPSQVLIDAFEGLRESHSAFFGVTTPAGTYGDGGRSTISKPAIKAPAKPMVTGLR